MSNAPPPMPPTSPAPLAYAVPGVGIACPRCGQFGAKRVSFTWWGGVLGPKLFKHTKCPACGFTFNEKTGRSNNTAIGIYIAVAACIGLVVGFAMFFMR